MPKEFKDRCTCSLCLFLRPNQVLLAYKKKHLVAGRWNGYGGEKKPGESARQGALREIEEETGGVIVAPDKLSRRAVIYFHNEKPSGHAFIVKVNVYVTREWQGEPKETDEMGKPVWFSVDNLPWDKMPLGDPHWLPRVLAGEKVTGHVHYGPKQKELLQTPEIRPTPNLVEDEIED